jgi:hypothetical protein
MANPTQQDLMAAHTTSRFNADKADANAQKNATVVDIVDPKRKPAELPPEHPFGGNDNNRRVVERILRESKNAAPAPEPEAPLTPGEAAAADLALADQLDAKTDTPLTDEQQEAAGDASTAAALAKKKAKDESKSDPAPTWKPNA